jgi:hypothetical protein
VMATALVPGLSAMDLPEVASHLPGLRTPIPQAANLRPKIQTGPADQEHDCHQRQDGDADRYSVVKADVEAAISRFRELAKEPELRRKTVTVRPQGPRLGEVRGFASSPPAHPVSA